MFAGIFSLISRVLLAPSCSERKMYPELYTSFAQQNRYNFSPHIDYYNSTRGQVGHIATNAMLFEYTQSQRMRLSSEWTPAKRRRVQPVQEIQPVVIYHFGIGMVPHYSGHIPSLMFRFGGTYGHLSGLATTTIR